MSIKHNCSRENYLNKSNANSDESVIEASPSHTPVRKKLKRITKTAKLRKTSLKTVPHNENTFKDKETISKEIGSHQNIKEVQTYVITKPLSVKGDDDLQVIKNREIYEVPKSKPSTSKNEVYLTLMQSPNVKNKVLPEVVVEVEKSKTKINSTGFSGELQNKVTIPEYRGITEPIQTTLSKNYHSMFVFYLIDEILEFTPNNFPKNSCVQLIGQFRFSEQKKSYILCSYKKDYGQSYQVKVDLREVVVEPNCDEEIILFGVIGFENITPIVVAKFFQSSIVNYQTYVKLMLRIRTTVPRENFNMICVTDDFRHDETVDKCNEEEFFNDLTRSLSVEQLDTCELSDSKLCAFLDEISFENL